MVILGFEQHNHSKCRKTTLAAAETYCAERKLRLTDSRRRVLEILLDGHRALGAYDILAMLGAEGLGTQPTVAYRALDFLVTHGFVHKIEKLNAYIACTFPNTAHSPAFLICRGCDAVAEAVQEAPFEALTHDTGFAIETAVIEAEGLCPACQPEAT